MERGHHFQTLESNQDNASLYKVFCSGFEISFLFRLWHWLLLQKPMLKLLIVFENVQNDTNSISFCISLKCNGQIFLFGQCFMYWMYFFICILVLIPNASMFLFEIEDVFHVYQLCFQVHTTNEPESTKRQICLSISDSVGTFKLKKLNVLRKKRGSKSPQIFSSLCHSQ